MTRKDLREMLKTLSEVQELSRRKTLHILRNTPDKEQAAYLVTKEIFRIAHEEMNRLLKDFMRCQVNEMEADRNKMTRRQEEFEKQLKLDFERLKREVKEEDGAGEEWKRDGA